MIAVLIGVLFSLIRSIKEIHYTIKSTNQHTIIPLSKSDFNPKDIDIKSRLPVIVLQLQGPLFFGSAESLLHSYKNSTKHEMLIIDIRKITMIDLSGVYLLEDLIKNIQDANIKVIVSNTNNYIKNILEKMNFFKHIGEKYYKDSKESIISTILESYKLEK